ncbi:hypothetical protein [Bradyrhizobium sp. Ash2021]|uniref:hypothetical protein n=1 Tax=Bradyrhizobium sp. Ash2021 TaxID=2954771 RepID=UPI002814F212|nr:hypothetical protein [Bradyrhizobium sp. Ash2021]WMT71903.1 hypothetical protein NL528_27975 [Bradyrhizobium sp. Ash2021]
MEKLETELAALRARAETLSSRHAAADAAFGDAKAKLQRHHLEADLDADDKARAKLEAAVAACAMTRDGYADALGEVQGQIADAAQRIAAERAAIERKTASEQLARDLDAVELALSPYLESARRLVVALEHVHHHYEAGEMARFVGNTSSQVEVAGAFALQELRGTVTAIRDGAAPIPAPKPEPAPVAMVEPVPPTQAVFMLRSAKYRDHDGRARFVGQYEDAVMPVTTAQRALRHGVAVSVADPRRAQLRGARGSDFNPNAPDVIDLDATEEPTGAPHMEPDPVLREANFTVLDRSAEARMLTIEEPRL